jgi:hypothetical protein
MHLIGFSKNFRVIWIGIRDTKAWKFRVAQSYNFVATFPFYKILLESFVHPIWTMNTLSIMSAG